MKLNKNFWLKMIPVFIMILVTFFLSAAIYLQMMATEQESCWERLEIATNSTAGKIKVRIDDQINFLKAMSDSYILSTDMGDTKKVGKYLDSVKQMTIFDRIDIIQPDNTLITQTGDVVQRDGKATYKELAAKGTHISGRRTSSFTGREVICCVCPIYNSNDEISGLLVGTLDCGTLSNLFEVFTYGKEAQLFLIDCTDGNYIIDNWHDELGNIYDIGKRKSADSDEMIDMTSAIINKEQVRFSYISQTNGIASYQYSAPIEGYNWELCVAVQEDVVFAKAHKMRQSLQIILVIELFMVLIYIIWNMLLTLAVSQSEDKAKHLEYEKAKNDARATFISNMSHDIRTPLNGIVGMLQIIKNNRDDDEKVDDCLRKIAISTQYLSTLTNDMLDISEIENNKLVLQNLPVNLKQLADELAVMVEQRASDVGVEYHMDYSELTRPHIIGSDVHIKRVLVNLIGNAIKYSKDTGKKVWLTIKDEEITLDKTKRMYHFIVKDNGIGISEEFQKTMYNAFEQEQVGARSDYQGYGLGLTIVSHLVKRMNGEIKLESKKGIGSTFTVSIPFLLNTKEDVQKQDVVPTTDLTGMKILVVEDNEFNLEIAQMLLTNVGAVIDTAANGKIATEMFASSELYTYDLILMDIMMPELDGCEATGVIRAMSRPDATTVPIIAMTANTFAEEIQRCKDVGMNGHIAKPLDINKLMMEVVKYNKNAFDKK